MNVCGLVAGRRPSCIARRTRLGKAPPSQVLAFAVRFYCTIIAANRADVREMIWRHKLKAQHDITPNGIRENNVWDLLIGGSVFIVFYGDDIPTYYLLNMVGASLYCTALVYASEALLDSISYQYGG